MKIKLAPNLEEIKVENNCVSTTFNGLNIEYTMPLDQYLTKNPTEVKKALQTGIALSSKLWTLEEVLNNYFKWNGLLLVTSAENGNILYPYPTK